jgi:hypothetical protein
MESDIMKGKIWIVIIGVFIAVGLIVTGFILFSGVLDSDEADSALSIGTAEMAQAGAGEGILPSDQEGGYPPTRVAGQQGNQGGNPPPHASSPTQSPGATPPPQNPNQGSCDNGFELNGSSNILVGQQFDPGDSFQVTWPLKNTGTCTWTSDYALNFVNGNPIGATTPIALTSTVAPGDSIVLSVQMTTPSQPDVYISFWKLQDGNGQLFGMDSPQDAPLRVKIEVVQSANTPSNPLVTAVPEIAITLPNTLSNGVGETILVDRCYDLVEGEEVSCSDPLADIKYTYSSIIGGYLRGVNGSLFSNGYASVPSESECESESYYGMPLHLVSGEKYLCIQTEYNGDTVYGWVKPTSFNAGGLTFNYLLWEPDTTVQLGEAIPAQQLLFTLNYGTDQTLLINKCFDFIEGEKAVCNGSEADIKYELSNSDNLIETMNDTELAFAIWYDDEAPNKSDCEAFEPYLSGYHYLNQQPDYYACFKTDVGSDMVYGWFRVTSFNNGGITFDYLVWEP